MSIGRLLSSASQQTAHLLLPELAKEVRRHSWPFSFYPRPQIAAQAQQTSNAVRRFENPPKTLAQFEYRVITQKVILNALAEFRARLGDPRCAGAPVMTYSQVHERPYLPSFLPGDCEGNDIRAAAFRRHVAACIFIASASEELDSSCDLRARFAITCLPTPTSVFDDYAAGDPEARLHVETGY